MLVGHVSVQLTATAPTLLVSLCDIGNVLPKDDLTMTTCSAPALEETVGLIFAHITRFFVRALQWQEDIAVRTHSSSTTITSFQYQDFMVAIQHETDVLRQIVATSSQSPPDGTITRTSLDTGKRTGSSNFQKLDIVCTCIRAHIWYDLYLRPCHGTARR